MCLPHCSIRERRCHSPLRSRYPAPSPALEHFSNWALSHPCCSFSSADNNDPKPFLPGASAASPGALPGAALGPAGRVGTERHRALSSPACAIGAAAVPAPALPLLAHSCPSPGEAAAFLPLGGAGSSGESWKQPRLPRELCGSSGARSGRGGCRLHGDEPAGAPLGHTGLPGRPRRAQPCPARPRCRGN